MMKISEMPKYEDYVDSGVEWLGDLPSHWDAVKMKFLFKDTSMKNKPNETLLSVTQSQGVVPREWVENRMVMPSGNLESFKFIAKGDFAISLRSFEGGLEYCHHDGIISPAYTVLKTKKDYLLAGYYKYLFKSQTFISELQTSIVGIREGKNISYEELQYSLLPIPAEEEQTRIANFLDKKTAQIDEAIAIKEQQINLLKEHKQIIIQQAVTQGLDPNVPMKDSGMDWIGEIPEHWEVTRAKYIFDEVDERTKNGDEELLSVSHMTGVTPRSEKNVSMFMAEDYTGSKLCRENDLVINIMWAWMGALGVSDRVGIVSPSYGIFRQKLKNTFNPFYLEYLLKSVNYVEYYNKISTGLHSSRLRFYGHMFFAMKMGYPSYEEQNEIMAYLQEQTKRIDLALDSRLAQIEKLKEYKTTLINSAVTGKIKITPEMVEQ
ncbi:restriction endonuclease subunit S [Morganella morganii subsp. morganii]|uniref:restriction endonuclease subunit S n=1 Tax=Morganella morganii TaxID=582 RepID=UPI000F83F145|nr:restriction endonuclease subunit S [Morganella morganii]MBT0445348.1 restriction endonuclease subunit S [Morganella morganii subsp. morganii]RTY19736.1 restriction endonuclease subunit S [Morganella morganii subsp. morganii]